MRTLASMMAAFAGWLLALSNAADAEDTSKVPKIREDQLQSRPRIEYPYEARRQRVAGSGIVVVVGDSATGKVVGARMAVSTGRAVLDNASVGAMRTARFNPERHPSSIPINWTITGDGGDVFPDYDVEAKNMDTVLARFSVKEPC